MARVAASMMWAGVSKSGSPRISETTVCPRACACRMSARTVLTAVGRRSVDRRETCKVARNKSLPHTSARLPPLPSQLARLECSRHTCRYVGDYRTRHNLCPNCQAPLLARYDLDRARETLTREVL